MDLSRGEGAKNEFSLNFFTFCLLAFNFCLSTNTASPSARLLIKKLAKIVKNSKKFQFLLKRGEKDEKKQISELEIGD